MIWSIELPSNSAVAKIHTLNITNQVYESGMTEEEIEDIKADDLVVIVNPHH